MYKRDQLPPRKINQKVPSSASKQDEEDQDEVTYEEIPDCVGMKAICNRNINYNDECIKQKSNKKECMERRNSILSKCSTLRSTFSCQRFVR